MAVRIADTLKQQNNLTTFPVAYGEDIWLDENKGSGTADYDTLQNLYNDGKLGGSSIQVETMPAASAENVGKIVQYVGETGSYEHGCFYECKDESGSYVWRYISTVKNGVFYTSDNITDSTIYPVGSVAVYTGEPLWGLFKGHHYEYVEDTTLTTYKFNGTKNGETLSFFLANKELKVGSALVRISDGYIVSYVSAINGTTITVQGRTYTETFTDVVETGETEEVASYTGWIDIGGGSDGGEEGTSIFYGTMDEWNALSTDAKKQYDYMADEQTGSEDNGEWKTAWTGSVSLPSTDGQETTIISGLSIANAKRIAIKLGSNQGNRIPDIAIVEHLIGVTNIGSASVCYLGDAEYYCCASFKVDFSNGTIKGNFISYKWAFTNTVVGVYWQ